MEESDGHAGVVATTTTDPVVLSGGGGGSFSQLLFSDEAVPVDDGQLVMTPTTSTKLIEHRDHHHHGCFYNFAAAAAPTFSNSGQKPPITMLSFGDYNTTTTTIDGDSNIYKINEGAHANYHQQLVFSNEVSKSSTTADHPTCMTSTCTSTTADSSSTSSTPKNININNHSSLPYKSNRKRNGCKENEPVAQSLSTGPDGPVRSQRSCKKTRSAISAIGGHAKVKKERLGERIAALQQLVSPFGKTDTASVLHEAMGYIKFLQEQVQVLCSPYLQRAPSNSSKPLLPQGIEQNEEGELKRKYLRNRGLCLIPVDCTLHVAESNGADFWSPAMVNNGSSER